MKLEVMIKGRIYIKKYVAPLNKIPVIVAVIEGKSSIGNVFFNPKVSVEYTIKKLTTEPTNNCGFPIIRGTSIDREYSE